MKSIFLSGWHFVRILRLILGIAGMLFAIEQQRIDFGIISGLLLIMGIFNTGCCGNSSCNTRSHHQKSKTK